MTEQMNDAISMDLAKKGSVGPFEGSKPRQLLVTEDQWQEMKYRMITDPIFGQLDFDGCGCWNGRLKLDFFGEERELALMIDSCYESQTEISDRQRETLQVFLEKWPELQRAVIQEIVRYYNEEERFSCGPDDPEEFAAWWPEIETVEEMLHWIEPESVVVAADCIMQDVYGGKRCLYLLFNYKWAEDLDDNGIGIRLLDEALDETRYKDIAF